jgi:hypothetical protein
MSLQIIEQPASISVREGTDAVFKVYVKDTTEYEEGVLPTTARYRWEYSTDGGGFFSPLSNSIELTGTNPGSFVRIKNTPPGMSDAIVRCHITFGEEEYNTIGALLIVISNDSLTNNFKMEYTSLFTGEEIDEAIRKILGNNYDTNIIPGTRLIGRYYDEPADLNDLDIPGVYTAYFFRNGPLDLEASNGNTPIQISVFSAEDYEYSGVTSLFQTIITMAYATEDMDTVGIAEGSSLLYLYYRDLLDPNIDINSQDRGWTRLLLSNGSMKVVNNLFSTDKNAVLSANMGRYLKKLIDGDAVGGVNLIQSSGTRRSEYHDSEFLKVWKQRSRDTDDGVVEDSEVTNSLLFKIDSSRATGKLGSFTQAKPFDSTDYFYRYLDNESLSIDTTNNHVDDNHVQGFSSNGTYAYMTKDAYDAKVIPTDEAFTASAWVKLNADNNEDANIFVQLWLCATNTSTGEHEQLPVQFIYVNESGFQTADGESDNINLTLPTIVATTMPATSAYFPENKWVRVAATIEGVKDIIAQGLQGTQKYTSTGEETGEIVTYDVTHVKVTFGVQGNTKAYFRNIKLERGKIATDGALSLSEMWNEFDNANYIKTVPIDKSVRLDTLEEKEGLVYTTEKYSDDLDEAKGRWIKRRMTTGGGGGFLVQASTPLDKEVLWYIHASDSERASENTNVQELVEFLDNNGYVETVTSGGYRVKHYLDTFYFYDSQGPRGAGWYPTDAYFVKSDAPPVNIYKLWLDTDNGKYNESESPDLKYYDTTYNKWRIVGAEPRPAWVIQDTPPESPDDDLMWITTSGIASVPYTKPDGTRIWLPIQAIWGSND